MPIGTLGLALTTKSKSVAYTTTQTGAAVWTPGTGKRIAVTALQIQVGGATAGTVRLWFGAAADTTYTAGTDQQLAFFDPSTPSSTLAPGLIVAFAIPVVCLNTDYLLRATTSAGVTVDIIVHGYEL